jgi:hypothetical protein
MRGGDIYMDINDDMVAAMENHQVTDDQGQLLSDGASEEQQPTVPNEPESAPSEKTTESEEATTKEAETEEDPNIAEDDRGRKYVPEKRFKEVYAKQKKLERELEEVRKAKELPSSLIPSQPIDRNAQLENELLFTKMPEFDPQGDNYNAELDQVAANIYLAKQGSITKLEAARQARKLASKITEQVAGIRSDANAVKREQADSGITSRVTSRASAQPDFDKMSLDDMEAYMKSNGQW